MFPKPAAKYLGVLLKDKGRIFKRPVDEVFIRGEIMVNTFAGLKVNTCGPRTCRRRSAGSLIITLITLF